MHLCGSDCPIPEALHRGPLWPMYIGPACARPLDQPVVFARGTDGKGWNGTVSSWKR